MARSTEKKIEEDGDGRRREGGKKRKDGERYGIERRVRWRDSEGEQRWRKKRGAKCRERRRGRGW